MARTSWGTPRQAKEIGARLRATREEKGISQRGLSVPGISPAYISRIEAGDRMPSLNVLRILAERLDVPMEYLETGAVPKPVPEEEIERRQSEVEAQRASLLVEVRKVAGFLGYDLVARG